MADTEAQALIETPTSEVEDWSSRLVALSRDTGSEARIDFPQEDGSILVIKSREGAEPVYEVEHEEDALKSRLVDGD